MNSIRRVLSLLIGHKFLSILDHPDGSVTTAKLADGSVTTAKLADGSVTTAKLAVLSSIKLSNLSALPASGVAGELCVVSGKLYIHTGAGWVVVGTQA